MKYIVVFIMSLILSCNVAISNEGFSNYEVVSEKFNYYSASHNENRVILVSLPKSYALDKKRKYPVLYVLNAEKNHILATEIASFLASKNRIHEMIVVGLPSKDNYFNENLPFLNSESYTISELAKKHEKFIRDEVTQFISEKFRINNTKFIAGHSMAGLFVSYLFLQNPTGYNGHIAISPAFHHAKQFSKKLKLYFTNSRVNEGAIYFSLGGLEHSLITKEFNHVVDIFKSNVSGNLYWGAEILKYSDHNTTSLSGMIQGLSWLYNGLSLTEEFISGRSFEDVILHYENLSKRIGYPIIPRENSLLGMASFCMSRTKDYSMANLLLNLSNHYYPDSVLSRKSFHIYGNWMKGGLSAISSSTSKADDLDESILISLAYDRLNSDEVGEAIELLKFVVGYFPNSINGFDSLGEAYEKGGEYDLAKLAYRKALELSIEGDDQEFINIEKRNIERVKKLSAKVLQQSKL
ncbi:alpha/beta hydrolase-fold protein [Pseudoalteromonas sp. B530]|uniref:alpha/beta hydrolase-fold protein n=1 Tax=Pseudoalteromonas sp. B530 TaxID=2994390 RepID=UPI00224AA7E3|nr:alpha/beta hydrolase-fold protein [Pseudoalteromonas sp. B530]MCX2766237.1 alpha/beta hydrolase-fold protein [Pseudoalteromonas sp. B530]